MSSAMISTMFGFFDGAALPCAAVMPITESNCRLVIPISVTISGMSSTLISCPVFSPTCATAPLFCFERRA